MEPVRVVCIYNDIHRFEEECACLVSNGYVMQSSNSSCNGESSDECFQAIFVLQVPEIAEEKILQSATPTDIESLAIALMNEILESFDSDQDAVTRHNDVFEILKGWRSATADIS